MIDLSILIPAKNEPYLIKTIEDVFQNIEGNTEVLVGLDDWGNRPLTDELKALNFKYKNLQIITASGPAGQREATNKLAEIANGKYVMKIDAHCSFSQGFDVVMMKYMDDKTIMAPYLLPLDAEKWEVKHFPKMSQYVFDTDLVMQHAPEQEGIMPETMCLQGSAWMITRENYFKWNVCDEELGSWGGQGAELGIRAYLNGGRCVTNKRAFYGHLFRTEETDFPYERGDKGLSALEALRKKYKNKSIAGLIERFNYPANWTKALVQELS